MSVRKRVNLGVYRGGGRKVRTTFTSDGSPVDLAGWDFEATVRNSRGQVIGAFTVGGTVDADGGEIIVDEEAGIMTIVFNSTWSIEQCAGVFRWDCLVTPDDDRQPFFPFGGTFTILEPETRP